MRCKPGDLCEIIGGVEGALKGRFVEVIEYAGEHPDYGPTWLVRSTTLDLVTEYGGVGDNAHAADDWLRPLPPPPPKVKVKEIELV